MKTSISVIALIITLLSLGVITTGPQANASMTEDELQDEMDNMCDANPNDQFCIGRNSNNDDDEGNNNDGDGQTTENENWKDSCYNSGYRDGQNGPFSEGTYNHCGDEAGGDKSYSDGFIDGCISVEGNTRDVCESATDA